MITNQLKSLLPVLLLFSGVFLQSCNSTPARKNVPGYAKVKWQKLNLSEYKYDLGTKVSFEHDNNKYEAVIVDFLEDEGRWYGLCFLNKGRLYGRQLQDGMTERCLDLLDICYLSESGTKVLQTGKTLKLDPTTIGIGARTNADNQEDLYNRYVRGLSARKKPQTDCTKSRFEANPVNECYFEIENIQ